MKPLLLTFVLLFNAVCLNAQLMPSDNGDGTYTNPVIPGDFPDPDVILVDDTYYMVSTTMFVFPGVTILKSKDLVNWEYCANAVPRFDFSVCYDLDGCNRYSHGQWATSMRYHNGKFYLLFVTLDEGGFICTADTPEGPWDIRQLPKGFYDPGLFFDDDGRIYVAHGYSEIYITEVNERMEAISADSLVFSGDIRKGLEGCHFYKINDYYYLYGTYGGRDGIQVALRSENVYGPYEQKIVISDSTEGINFGIHQGALIQTQSGEWWTVLFVDSGPFGRFPSLQPVTWTDGWPMVGINGKAVVTHKKPDVGRNHAIRLLPTSDEFESEQLGMQWGWNHNPVAEKWSLTERKGYLRLHTVAPVNGLREAQNTLTQRSYAKRNQENPTHAGIRLGVGNMKNGDEAGLAVFQDPYAYIGVRRHENQNFIVMVNNGETIDSVLLQSDNVNLRTSASNATGKAVFSYSVDAGPFVTLGTELTMKFNLSVFTGNKFCIFNYATIDTGGFVDVGWFTME